MAGKAGGRYYPAMDEAPPMPETDRSHWPVRKVASFDLMARQHVRDWQAAGSSARLQAAWDMVVEAWAMKNRNPDELRLQRFITAVRRG